MKRQRHAKQSKQPKYIIVLSESQPLPLLFTFIIMRYNLSGATIYERVSSPC